MARSAMLRDDESLRIDLVRLLALFFAAIALVLACTPPRLPTAVLLVGATVVHPRLDGPPIVETGCPVLVVGTRIQAVGPEAATQAPPDARIIDLRGTWVVPGYIDAHMHLNNSGTPYARPSLLDFTDIVPQEDDYAWAEGRRDTTLRVCLANGIVCIACMAGTNWMIPLRTAGLVSPAMPRMHVALAVAVPYVAHLKDADWAVRTPDEMRILVDEARPEQPDSVKYWMGAPKNMAGAERRLVGTAATLAHELGVPFIVHALRLSQARVAVEAGADVLAHSIRDTAVDEVFATRLARAGVAYVTTLCHLPVLQQVRLGRWRPTPVEARQGDPQTVERFAATQDTLAPAPATFDADCPAAVNLRMMAAAGVTIAVGTDSGDIGLMHGVSFFRETEAMADCGIPPARILASATLGGARTLRLEHDLGDVAAGRSADLVVLDADPLTDAHNLSRIRFVMRNGVLWAPTDLLPPRAAKDSQ